MAQFELLEHKFVNVDYIAHSSVELSNHTMSGAMPNVSVH